MTRSGQHYDLDSARKTQRKGEGNALSESPLFVESVPVRCTTIQTTRDNYRCREDGSCSDSPTTRDEGGKAAVT